MEMIKREMGKKEFKAIWQGKIPFCEKVERIEKDLLRIKCEGFYGLTNDSFETILPAVFNEIEFQDNGDVVARRDKSFLVFSNHMNKCNRISSKKENNNPVVYDEVIITPNCIIGRTEDNKFYNFDVQGRAITGKAYDTFEEAEVVGCFAW